MRQWYRQPGSDTSRQWLRWVVVSLGILALTVSLASRTADFHLSSHPTVDSQDQKGKIQHRDRDAFVWAPVLPSAAAFYLPVSVEPVVSEQAPILSVEVDDCLCNRPPPLS